MTDRPSVAIETLRGEPIEVHDWRLVPHTRAIRGGFQVGGWLGVAFAWAWPIGIDVHGPAGRSYVSIVDPTRQAIIGLAIGSLVVTTAARAFAQLGDRVSRRS
jgi:hypothetical protein